MVLENFSPSIVSAAILQHHVRRSVGVGWEHISGSGVETYEAKHWRTLGALKFQAHEGEGGGMNEVIYSSHHKIADVCFIFFFLSTL